MKRILILLLTVCMIAAAFVGCAQKPEFGSSSKDTNGNGLRDDVELKIMKARYADDMGEEFDPAKIIVKYYGTYNGAIAVKVHRKDLYYIEISSNEAVGEYVFKHPGNGKLKIYVNEELISLTQAYYTGVLSDSDLSDLAGKYATYKNE